MHWKVSQYILFSVIFPLIMVCFEYFLEMFVPEECKHLDLCSKLSSLQEDFGIQFTGSFQ